MKPILLALILAAAAQETPAPAAHFHHLHLNVTDPAAAIEFYTGKFDCEKARFMNLADAVWAQKSWLLFTKVSSAAPSEITSAIWHFGWGAEDMKATYQKQLDLGTKFDTPITALGDIESPDGKVLASMPNFFFAYVQGPNKELIELNTANHHHFGHLHLLSDDPAAAGEWYVKHFGIKPPARGFGREKRFIRSHQIAPSASLMMDNVNIIIYPVEYARKVWPEHWKEGTKFESSKGRVVDHVGFSVDNLEETLARLRKDGVKVTDEIRTAAGGRLKYAFIEGPDSIRIELVEEK